MVVIAYYIQNWNKKERNNIISRVISSHIGTIYTEPSCMNAYTEWAEIKGQSHVSHVYSDTLTICSQKRCSIFVCACLWHLYHVIKSACGVMVIVVGNEYGDTISNPGRGWLHFTEQYRYESNYPLSSYGWISRADWVLQSWWCN